MSDKIAAEMIGRLLAARTHAHILHLKTTSFEEHGAIGTFYEEVGSLADTLAEVYQGMRGVRLDIPFETIKPTVTSAQLLRSLCNWVDANRDEVGSPTDTPVQNIIDEVQALIYQTMYRLTLK